MRPGSLLITIFITGLLFWGGVACLVSCGHNPDERAVWLAEKALEASVDNPESIKVIGISGPDSVFGREYVTAEERIALSMTMMKISSEMMEASDSLGDSNLFDGETAHRMERQLEAMSALRALFAHDGLHPIHAEKPFKGWKVKIEFEATTLEGQPYHAEYWFILDKRARCVLKSFEVPLP